MLGIVEEHGFVSLNDLARRLNISVSTVRRDLDFWDKKGKLKRTHGGAVYIGDGAALPAFDDRTASQADEKKRIARVAAGRIRDGDAVILDGGTTTFEVARLLVGRRLQVVTNSLPIANLLASSGDTDLVFLGGYIYPRTGVALGPLTMRMLEDIHVQQTILSVGGITQRGFFNSNLLLVESERRMMHCADEVVVVADHTKIGRPALAHLCELSAVHTLIVDSGINDEQRQLVAGPNLVLAGEAAS